MKYINAGTVEFLVPADDQNTHYFLEMNTKIQVEHGITEQICSIDLIEKQISIAYTKKFDFEQKDIAFKGHAIQAEESAVSRQRMTSSLALAKLIALNSPRIPTGLILELKKVIEYRQTLTL